MVIAKKNKGGFKITDKLPKFSLFTNDKIFYSCEYLQIIYILVTLCERPLLIVDYLECPSVCYMRQNVDIKRQDIDTHLAYSSQVLALTCLHLTIPFFLFSMHCPTDDDCPTL